MTDQQTEIPIEVDAKAADAETASIDSVREPLASPPEDVASPPETLANPAEQTPAEGTATFTILADVPFRFSGWNMCCVKYSAELWQDDRDTTYVTFTHADECDVWTYL